MTGALLAGGLSSRMGRDKCLIEMNGMPLWRRQYERLQAVCSEVVVVAPTRPVWCGDEIPWVPDAVRNRGPLGGLAAALEAARDRQVLLLAVDLPAMTSRYLAKLVGRAESGVGVVPVIDGMFQPLSAVYPCSVLARVRERLKGDDWSFQSLLRALVAGGVMEAVPVSPGERGLFRNWNSPVD